MTTKEEVFEDICYKLEATAVNFYSPCGDKREKEMWNLLLSTRDKLKKEFQKECPDGVF